MIPANKGRLFDAVFAGHAERRLRRTFARARIQGLGVAAAARDRAPLLLVSNHVSWWDPLVALWLSRRVLHLDGHALMDAANLRRLPFFRRVGAFGVDLTDPRDGARALRYGARLLDRPGRMVWVFPEGRERPGGGRPLPFLPGAAAMARLAPDAVVLPVGLAYVFAGTERPDLYVSVGAALPAVIDPAEGARAQAEAVAAELDRIAGAVAGRDAGFETRLAHGRRLASAAEGTLARLTAPHGAHLRDRG